MRIKIFLLLSYFIISLVLAQPQTRTTPISLEVVFQDGSVSECLGIGFFVKYRAKTVVIEGIRDSFLLEDAKVVHRLSLKYLVSAGFEVVKIEGKWKLHCEWTARFPGESENRIFKGYFPENLESVFKISLVCMKGRDEYHIDLQEISVINRKQK